MKYLLFSLLIIFISCKKEEKELLQKLENVRVYRDRISSYDKKKSFSSDNLNNLKTYFDSVVISTEQFYEVVNDDDSKKTIRDYLKKNDDYKYFCDKLFIKKSVYSRILDRCNESVFDICPYTLSQYDYYKNSVIHLLESFLEQELFSKTNCKTYKY